VDSALEIGTAGTRAASPREAEEYVRAELLNFQPETTEDEDEQEALFGSGPIISPDRIS
jgi:hypothetical protein